MVVNVASEGEHAEETTCSLEFGKRMTAVRSRAAVVTGVDAGGEREALEPNPDPNPDHACHSMN
jgi:hypothetical protein